MRNPAPTRQCRARSPRTARVARSRSTTSSSRGTAAASQRLLATLRHHARMSGVALPFTRRHRLRQHHPPDEETPLPGSQEIERRIKSLIRWNAMAMVVRANRDSDGIGGHISTYASAATLYEVGFNHFFRGKGRDGDGDIIYFQGHASPGHLRARLPRRPAVGREARQLPPRAAPGRRPVVVSASVADARLLGVPDRLDGPRPDHVDLPGALQSLPRRSRPEEAVDQQGLGVPRRRRDRRARIARRDQPGGAREARQPDLGHQLQPAAPRRPGARQRPDHPGARSASSAAPAGTSSRCSGAATGIRSSRSDHDGLLAKRMGEVVDGQYQKYAVESGAYFREHFFGTDPRLLEMVKHLSDDQLKTPASRRPRSGQGLQRLQGAPSKPRASRPSSSPARSRATAWAKRVRARTSRTSRRR